MTTHYPDRPIIRSLLDLDFYKLTMLQYILARGLGSVDTRFALQNRTRSVALSRIIPEPVLRSQLDSVMDLRWKEDELDYLASLQIDGKPIFQKWFIDFLRTVFHLSGYDLEYTKDENPRLVFPGPWQETSPWETMALSIINELHFHYSTTPDERAIGYVRGRDRLHRKIGYLNELWERTPDPKFDIMEFATRRRASRDWQRYEVEQLVEGLRRGILSGVSNVALAREFGLTPRGTMAHELFMIQRALVDNSDDAAIRRSPMQVVDQWEDFYGNRLSVALPDTFGSDHFFKDFGADRARRWKAWRQDSGIPVEFGRKLLAFLQGCRIDPLSKRLVPSDGLKPSTIQEIVAEFAGKIQLTFGWGTNLGNDLGFPPISIVIKAEWANGHPLVKLSDNLNKAMGPPIEVERMKRIFGHTSDYRAECVY